jgi:hypothetical protein
MKKVYKKAGKKNLGVGDVASYRPIKSSLKKGNNVKRNFVIAGIVKEETMSKSTKVFYGRYEVLDMDDNMKRKERSLISDRITIISRA